jgi:4-hydroxy-tetrahydrodipicolinate reductase
MGFMDSIRIALIGYGKMGRTIERMGLEQGHTFPLIVDVDNRGDLNPEMLAKADVAIEFTTPESAPGNIITCLESGIPVVAGTTGWSEHAPRVLEVCRNVGGTLFTASNFSIGVNILFSLNRQLAKIMDAFPQYRASIKEVHHIHKLDAPSGTALNLAEQIIKENGHITGWSLESDDNPAILPIKAVREGEVRGIHTIGYESELDIITIGHEAKSREAFAAGALLAAAFIRDKKGVFGMTDLLKL